MRMPLFTWTALCTSMLMVFAFPALTVAGALLGLDRYLGMHFFTNDAGGNMMNYANLFWIWGHPEVYILILPAFGVYSEVVATFSGRRLFGYTSLVYATAAIALLSFTVWLHHFFTMGASANVNAFFGIATMIIAVPTGVKMFDWLFTMYRGRIRFHACRCCGRSGFIVTFVIGGMTGVLLGAAAGRLSHAQHDLPGRAFPQHADSRRAVRLFRRLQCIGSPRPSAFALDERWGRRAFWCWMIGFYLAFMPLYCSASWACRAAWSTTTSPAGSRI